MSNTLTIAYHAANKNIAEDLQTNLNPIGYNFTEAVCGIDAQTLASQLRDDANKVLLVISDNFLKSEQCMHELLEVFQELIRTQRVLPVITEGLYRDENTGIFIKKPTSFDRVSDAIQYMNYWQDEYLEVRRKKRELLNSDSSTDSVEEALNAKLGVIRNISSDIGEFFRFLRSKRHVEYVNFRANNFAEFFQFAAQTVPDDFVANVFETETWVDTTSVEPEAPAVENITDTEEAPIEIASIPGMDLLADTSTSVEEDTFDFLQDIQNEDTTIAETEGVPEPEEIENLVEEIFEEEEENTTEIPEADANETEEEMKEIISEQAELTPQTEEEVLAAVQQLISEDNVHAALQQYETALVSSPESVNLRYRYATSLIRYNKDFDGARTQLKKLVEYDASNFNTHFLLAEIAEIKEDYSDAKTHFEQVLALNPTHSEAPYRLANLLSNHFEGSETQAGELFATAIVRNPKNADAHYQYAVLQDEYFDDPDLALKHYQQTIALDAKHPFAHYDMAVLYHGLEDMENAKAAYEIAGAINPEVKTPQNDAAFLGTPLEYELPPEGIIRDDVVYEEVVKENLIVEEEVAEVEPLVAESIKLEERITTEEEEEEELELEVVNEEEVSIETEEEEITEVAEEEIEELEPASEATITEETVAEEIESVQPESLERIVETSSLQADIKRLEDLVLKNQNMLLQAQQNLVQLSEEEEVEEEITPTQVRVDKVVLITGATSGIGRATADVFAEAGYRLILTGRRGERLEALKMDYEEKFGSDVLTHVFDVRNQSAVQEMMASLEDNWRDIDILINNAGLAKGFAPIHEGEISHWETMIDTNVKGLLYMTRAVSPYMVARKQGHIVNVCSSAGKEAYPNGNVYCATKFAVDALTKSMRLDLHKHNVRVSQVSPGHVEETEFAVTRFDGDAERAQIYNDFQPLKANDVADTIFFLATRPAHVNIQDVVMFGTQQASSMVVNRSGRS